MQGLRQYACPIPDKRNGKRWAVRTKAGIALGKIYALPGIGVCARVKRKSISSRNSAVSVRALTPSDVGSLLRTY